ncbi:MAG: hypothetical protein Q8916_05930 [Bacteroidota bacterium]|nr:hypothetical protein [Bacteroidota bacterium]MDP4229927.1 hypothetical protein [Bacteroidota bacterium]MDP4236070.1 hypothetical protein [Bacteroidota bacterium]
MKKEPETTKQLITAASIATMLVAFVMIVCAGSLFAQNQDSPQKYDTPVRSQRSQEYIKSIDDLMHERLETERAKYSAAPDPELLKLEANYVRTDAPTGEIVLHEASFHLEPRYMSFSAEGRERTDTVKTSPQSVMYFVGSARTPLALPLVSNLSKVLSGDEASYTVSLGILPLPKAKDAKSDSIHYYVIIERAIESNRSESEKKFERYAKEFTARPGDPIRLRLENTPPDRQTYIFKIDDNEVLNFYEDFARHFKEDIILNGERLKYALGKADLSMQSSRLSIPYTVARTSAVKVDLLSVVDPAHPLTLIDSVMRPADYLAEHDMKPYPNGTYQYRITAKEVGSGKVLFDETKSFEKKSPMLVGNGVSIANADTLEVGGKKESAQKALQELNMAYNVEKVKTDRLEATLTQVSREKEELKTKVDATQGNVIAGLRYRVGAGFGHSSGLNLFVGVESNVPSLTLDLSYGLLYSNSAPYLAYDNPSNFSQIFSSPKSLGLQLGWSPLSIFNGIIQPVVRLGYYGIYSAESPSTVGGIHSAALISPAIGIMTTPGGAGSNFGVDLTFGLDFGLGIPKPAEFDVQVKCYQRF